MLRFSFSFILHHSIKCNKPQKFGKRVLYLKSNFNKVQELVCVTTVKSSVFRLQATISLSKQATVFSDCCIDVRVTSSLDVLSSHFPAYLSLLSCSNSRAWANQLNKFSHYRENKSTTVRGFFSLSISPGCWKQNIIGYNLKIYQHFSALTPQPPIPHFQTPREKTTASQEAITEPCTGRVSNARLKSRSRH